MVLLFRDDLIDGCYPGHNGFGNVYYSGIIQNNLRKMGNLRFDTFIPYIYSLVTWVLVKIQLNEYKAG